MHAQVYAHKGIGMECKLAGGKTIAVPAGGKYEGDLTGDQLGVVRAYLGSQAHYARLAPSQLDGKVVCAEAEVGPPKGSKAHRALHPEEYVAKKAAPVVPVKEK